MNWGKLIQTVLRTFGLTSFLLTAISGQTRHTIAAGWFLYDDYHGFPVTASYHSLNLLYSYRITGHQTDRFGKFYYGHVGYMQRTVPQQDKQDTWFGALAIAYEGEIGFKGISIPTMSYTEIYIYENDPFMSHEPEDYRHNIGSGIYWPVAFSRPSVWGTGLDLRFASRVACIPVIIPGVFSGEGYPVIFMTHTQLELTHGIFSLLINHINQYQMWMGNRDYWVVRPLEIMMAVAITGDK